MTIEKMRIQVELACNDEADFEETMELLDSHIHAHPENAEYLRMRIAMFDAAYDHISAWKDRKVLALLQPEDLDNQLALLARQHKSAYWITDEVFEEKMQALFPDEGGDEDEDDDGEEYEDEEVSEEEEVSEHEDDEDTEDEPVDPALLAAREALEKEAASYSEQLEQQAMYGFVQLMKEHATDAGKADKILTAWSDANIWNPWLRYSMILQALAAHPDKVEFKKERARLLVAICDAVEEDSAKAPPGFFEHMILGRMHAHTVYEAINAIDEIDNLEDADLLTQKGHLLKALDKYSAAADAYRLAAKAYEAAQQNSSEEEQEILNLRLQEVLQEADTCQGGRASIHARHFAELENTMAQLGQLSTSLRNQEVSFSDRTEAMANLKSALGEWQEHSTNTPEKPNEQEMQEIKSVAAKVANSTVGLVSWAHIDIAPMEKAAFKDEMHPWLDEMQQAMAKTDMQFLSWFQNMANVLILKREAPGACWLAPTQEFALLIEAAGNARLKRCVSLLSDGSLLLTSDARSSSYYLSGPRVHSFALFKSTPVTDMLALHEARLHAHLARQPGVEVRTITDLADIEEFENLLRTHAREFRLAYGITDPEIRGMNVQFNDVYAHELKREVAERLAALQAG